MGSQKTFRQPSEIPQTIFTDPSENSQILPRAFRNPSNPSEYNLQKTFRQPSDNLQRFCRQSSEILQRTLRSFREPSEILQILQKTFKSFRRPSDPSHAIQTWEGWCPGGGGGSRKKGYEVSSPTYMIISFF